MSGGINMRQNPMPNEIYRHFKGMLYQIINIAKHSETMEVLVVYQQLYAPYGVFVRPLDMFMSEVDHDKYPDVTQKYRFEKIQEPAWAMDPEKVTCGTKQATNETVNTQQETIATKAENDVQKEVIEESEEALDPGILQFLEADTYEEKLEILNQLHPRITNHMIDTMAVCIDVEVQEGEVEQRYQELMGCLLKLEHFECNRLR